MGKLRLNRESLTNRKESDDFINNHLNLVHSIAQKFVDVSSHQYQDVYSEGLLGLTEAARKYKAGEAKFTTYAYYRIRGAILNYLQANKSLIRIPWRRNKDKNLPGFVTEPVEVITEEHDYEFINLMESLKIKLTEQAYKILNLKYEGYTEIEISRLMNISEAKVNEIMLVIREVTSTLIGG